MKLEYMVKEEAEKLTKLIEKYRNDGLSLRKISEEIKKEGFEFSHSSIRNIWNDELDGKKKDAKRMNERAKKVQRAALKGDENGAPPAFDLDLFDLLLEENESEELGRIYAYALTLCESNMKAHIAGEERLKVEYVKYLRDIKYIINE